MPAINVKMEMDVLEGLKDVIVSTGLTENQILELALRNFIAEVKQDAEDIAAAEKVWNSFILSGEPAVPAEDVFRKAGL